MAGAAPAVLRTERTWTSAATAWRSWSRIEPRSSPSHRHRRRSRRRLDRRHPFLPIQLGPRALMSGCRPGSAVAVLTAQRPRPRLARRGRSPLVRVAVMAEHRDRAACSALWGRGGVPGGSRSPTNPYLGWGRDPVGNSGRLGRLLGGWRLGRSPDKWPLNRRLCPSHRDGSRGFTATCGLLVAHNAEHEPLRGWWQNRHGAR